MYEGNLIRPLGLVTLNFAYAEAELDTLLEALPSSEPYNDVKRQWPVGRKLSYAQKLIRDLHAESLGGLSKTVKQARNLFEQRNALVHSSIFAGGRMISNRKSVPNKQVSPDDLVQLAELIFTWKENIYMHRWRHLLPLLAGTKEQHGP